MKKSSLINMKEAIEGQITTIEELMNTRENYFCGAFQADYGPCQEKESHVHFDVFFSIDEYMDNITDIEVMWFEHKVTSRTMVTMGAWRSKHFYNARAAFHYKMWGKALEEEVAKVYGLSFAAQLDRLFMSAKWDEAVLLLTHSQLFCREKLPSNVELEIEDPTLHYYAPDIDSCCVREVSVTAFGEDSILTHEHWFGDVIINSPEPSDEFEPRQKNCETLLQGKRMRSKGETVSLEYEFIKPEVKKIYEKDRSSFIGKIRSKVFGTNFSIREEKSGDVFTVSTLSNPQVQMAFPCMCPTISMHRWIDSISVLPPIVVPPLVCETLVPVLRIGGRTAALDVDQFWLKKDFKNVKRNCKCKLRPDRVCLTHGAYARYQGDEVAFFCSPKDTTVFIVDWTNGRSQMTRIWGTAYRPGRYSKCYKFATPREDRAFDPFFFRSPSYCPMANSPLALVSSSTCITARLWIEDNYIVGSIGNGEITNWGLPIDLVFGLGSLVHETTLILKILLHLILFESYYSPVDLQSLEKKWTEEKEWNASFRESTDSLYG